MDSEQLPSLPDGEFDFEEWESKYYGVPAFGEEQADAALNFEDFVPPLPDMTPYGKRMAYEQELAKRKEHQQRQRRSEGMPSPW